MAGVREIKPILKISMETTLPKLKILNKSEKTYNIVFFDSLWIDENHITTLLTSNNKIVWGRFKFVDHQNKTACFIINDIEDDHLLKINSEYAYLDSYWGERAVTVLDSSLKWEKSEFKPVDAIEFNINGKRISGVIGQKPPEGAKSVRVIKGGWDHEHCVIFQEKISCIDGQVKIGYKNQYNEWVCEECFNKYVKPKSLSFIHIP